MASGHSLFLVLLLFCQILGLVLFLRGFFPLKKAIQGMAAITDFPPEPSAERPGDPLSPKFGRLVIVLIDALRADFVFNNQSRMPFIQEIIRTNKSFSFLAKAHPPTVTMPRIKALTTGGIPGFIDVVFNIDSEFLQEDNLISQMKFANKKIVFYGDDTWMRLFPEHFERTDGTTSFFVTDYTEVDDNVTRHIDSELKSDDWDIMILHFLGLDHIGHIAGPSSPLVGPKLLEMDHIINNIYNAMFSWDQKREAPSLMVLCGDHGMSDSGSHGGASSSETSTPLVFMSPLFERLGGEVFNRKEVQQIDLVPTLSLLLGLPIPQNSIGVAIPSLFGFHTPREMLRALQLNTHQLSKTLTANGHSVENMYELHHAHKLHSNWLKSTETGHSSKTNLKTTAGKVAKQYILVLEKMTSRMTASLSKYDLHAMICGIAVLIQTLYWVACGLCRISFPNKTDESLDVSVTSVFVVSGAILLVAILHLLACSSTVIGGSDVMCAANSVESFLYSSTVALQAGVSLAFILLRIPNLKSSLSWTLSWFSSLFQSRRHFFLITGVLLHTFSLLSSSFVEEEHQTWHFLTSTFFMIILLEKSVLFCKKNTRVASEVTPEKATQSENLDGENCGRYRKQKPLNHSESLTHTGFGTDQVIFTDVNLGDLFSRKEFVNAETIRGENNCYSREAAKAQYRDLSSCLVVFVLLGLGRLSRAWNQTGIKWADRPDIGDWLVKPENKIILSITYFTSLVFIIGFRYGRHDILTSVVFIVGSLYSYLYRAVTGNVQLPWLPNEPITKGIIEARVTYCCVTTMVLWNIILLFKANNSKKKMLFQEYICDVCEPLEGLLSSFLLLEVLLQRPHNAAILAIFVLQESILSQVLWKSKEKSWIVTLSSLWMGQAMYFSLGNSNSLASVDISAGYVGLEDFVPCIMVPLTYVATYCGPSLWLMAGILSVIRNTRDAVSLQVSLYQGCYVIALCQSLVLGVYCILVFSQRYHLFVWSVFSPKLLYETTKTLLCSVFCISVICLTCFLVKTERLSLQKSE